MFNCQRLNILKALAVLVLVSCSATNTLSREKNPQTVPESASIYEFELPPSYTFGAVGTFTSGLPTGMINAMWLGISEDPGASAIEQPYLQIGVLLDAGTPHRGQAFFKMRRTDTHTTEERGPTFSGLRHTFRILIRDGSVSLLVDGRYRKTYLVKDVFERGNPLYLQIGVSAYAKDGADESGLKVVDSWSDMNQTVNDRANHPVDPVCSFFGGHLSIRPNGRGSANVIFSSRKGEAQQFHGVCDLHKAAL